MMLSSIYLFYSSVVIPNTSFHGSIDRYQEENNLNMKFYYEQRKDDVLFINYFYIKRISSTNTIINQMKFLLHIT